MAEVERLRAALAEIEAFGYENSGHGYSCARMASVALGRSPLSPEKWFARPTRRENADFHRKIDDLDLTVRTKCALINDGAWTVGDLMERGEREWLRVPNFGRKGLNEVKEVLASFGLHLAP